MYMNTHKYMERQPKLNAGRGRFRPKVQLSEKASVEPLTMMILFAIPITIRLPHTFIG